MNDDHKTRDEHGSPLLHDENGELSLHFGFPTIQSRMLKAAPEQLVLDYTRTMMGFLLFQPRPERIIMIGLGGGSLAKYCHRHLPRADFWTIELSAEVIALREAFGIPKDNERFRVICADGAEYLQTAEASTDVLIVDGFDCDGQPPQLCSAAFYDDCRSALRPGGVLVVNLCADDPGRDACLARIQQTFEGRSLAMTADDEDNIIVFAALDGPKQHTPFPPSFHTITERLRALEALHPVELDKTAQKIIGQDAVRPAHRSRGNKRTKRR